MVPQTTGLVAGEPKPANDLLRGLSALRQAAQEKPVTSFAMTDEDFKRVLRETQAQISGQPFWDEGDAFYGIMLPSIELARAGMTETRTASDLGKQALGHFPNSPYCAVVHAPRPCKVRFEISCDELMEPSSIEVRIETPGHYSVNPTVRWKTGALRASREKHKTKVTWKVWIDDGPEESRTREVIVEPVSYLPLVYAFSDHSIKYTFHFVAAYANENHPMIKTIIKEALETRVVGRFAGMKEDDPESVKKQVLAIWWAMQKRGIVYSDIAHVELDESNVFGVQRVRFFEDVISDKGANCLDGTLVFAALLRHIGLEPVICLKKEHAFLGFYLDKAKTNLAFLETTLLNSRQAYLIAKERVLSSPGRLPLGIFPEADKQTCPLTIDVAQAMFEFAMERGAEKAKIARSGGPKGDDFFLPVDLSEQRKFTAPIPSPDLQKP